MGKKRKLYQAKRLLALILAVTMVVSMVPANVYAEELTPEDDVAVLDAATSSEDPDEVEGVQTTGTDEAAAPADELAPDGDGESQDGTDEPVTPAANEPQDDTDEPSAQAEEPARPVYTIEAPENISVEYTGRSVNAQGFEGIKLVKTEDGETEELDAWENGVTIQWKNTSDSNIVAPTNVGSYKLTLSYAKVDGVHDGAEKTINVEITKASVRIYLESFSVTPGTRKSAVKTPVIDWVSSADDKVDPEDIVLATDIRPMLGGELEDNDELKGNVDYVMDITPSFKADASAERKAIYANYEDPEPFTYDIRMANLITTWIDIKYVKTWDDAGHVIKIYDEKAADAPVASETTYQATVVYEDANAESGYSEVPDAAITGEWITEDGEAPINAGEYTYRLIYKGDGEVYAEASEDITVKIDQARVSVKPVVRSGQRLEFLEGTELREVLSRVTYQALDGSGADITSTVKAKHIWGTSYDDGNASQLYEPLFTLQIKDGTTWKSIDLDQPDYKLERGATYRIIYDGKKAIYNADGTYNYRTAIQGINDSENINGYDDNYVTDVTSDTMLEEITLIDGIPAEIDVTQLLADGKAIENLDQNTATTSSKTYDGKSVYISKSQYKNNVGLKTVGEQSTKVDTLQKEFTYTWYRNTYDLLDKEIYEQNKTWTTESSYNFDSYWNQISVDVAPVNAGVYKLEITYTDQYDDGKLYYAEKPAVVYYVIDKLKVKVILEGEYEALSGQTVSNFISANRADFNNNYKVVSQDDKDFTFPEGYSVGAINWAVEETVTTKSASGESTTGAPRTFTSTSSHEFSLNSETATYDYKLKVDSWSIYDANGYSYDVDGSYYDATGSYHRHYYNLNYTFYPETKKVEGEGEQATASRDLEDLNGTAPITVNKMGETKLNVALNETVWVAMEKSKPYDAKPFVIPDGLITVTKDGGEAVDPKEVGIVYYTICSEYGERSNIEDAIDVGKYDLYARFLGSKEYAPLSEPEGELGMIKLGQLEITQRPLTLTVNLPKDTYEAGTYADDILDYEIPGNITVGGYVDEHASMFTEYYEDEGYYIDAWQYSYPDFQIYESGETEPVSGRLARDKDYEVKYTEGNNHGLRTSRTYTNVDGRRVTVKLARNYKVETEVVTSFRTVKGYAEITSVSSNNGTVTSVAISKTQSIGSDNNTKQVVSFVEAIKFSTYNGSTKGGKSINIEGNLVALRITAPAEFTNLNTARYENEVKDKGGYVLSSGGNNFTVLFDALDGSKTLEIRWEDKYIETIVLDFDNAVKLENLNDAVAPKSLAFNAPDKKMAVGEGQQLDVKITKNLMGDIIYLNYESSDESKLSVNEETGYVTALAKGKATITAYPMHFVNGKKEKIDTNVTAKVEITVTEVSAPKSVKVTSHGTFANVKYTMPQDGYRREIYVVDNDVNKNAKKADAIEDLVIGMQNNRWEGTFAIAPIYVENEVTDNRFTRQTDGSYMVELAGLLTTHNYTVYVRNVAGIRALDSDNSVSVVENGAKGTAASFKTLKSEVIRLKSELDTSIDGITYSDGDYTVVLSPTLKTVSLKTSGLFYDNAKDPAADSDDTTWLTLGLSKDDQKNYENPKLEYAVYGYNKKTNKYEYGSKDNYVSIDKKGKIKLTGVTGEDVSSEIRVRDTVTGKAAYVDLHVVAAADSVTAKKSYSMSVGQSYTLSSLLTYKLGKQTLTEYNPRDINTAKINEAIKNQHQEVYFEFENGVLRAIKEGGSLALELTDRNVEKVAANATNATAKVTFKTTSLAAAKSPKAYDVIDDRFGLTFTYAGGANAFLIEIADAKRQIASQRINWDTFNSISENTWNNYRSSYSHAKIYNANKGSYTFYISANAIKEIANSKLTKETQYTVTVTALYDGISAKSVSTKVKTTKIPAYSSYLYDRYDSNNKLLPKASQTRGGMSIRVSDNNYTLNGYGYNTVLSGNSYTLTANVDRDRGRINDTLVWTVENGKIATVKAAAGSYAVTLKGVKPGRTILEVKSKIWGNKVIARYGIEVVAVGDAYSTGTTNKRYYGDNEPANPGRPSGDSTSPGGYTGQEMINVGDRKKISVGDDEKSFIFKVPETAIYSFEVERAEGAEIYIDLSDNNGHYIWIWGDDDYLLDLGLLEEGTTVKLYAELYDYYYLGGSYKQLYDTYVTITCQRIKDMDGNSATITSDEYGKQLLKFTAQEGGRYQFSAASYAGTQNEDPVYLYLYGSDASLVNGFGSYYGYDKYGLTVEWPIPEGGSVYLAFDASPNTPYTVTAEKISLDLNKDGSFTDVPISAGGKKYVTYTVEKEGYYQFSSENTAQNDYISVTMEVNDEYVGRYANRAPFELKYYLYEGDIVCLTINNNDSNDVTLKVKEEEIEIKELPEGQFTLPSGDGSIYSYQVTAVGVYTFTMTSNSGAMSLRIYDNLNNSAIGYDDYPSEDEGSYTYTVSSNSLAPGQTVYINPVNESGGGSLEVTINVTRAEVEGELLGDDGQAANVNVVLEEEGQSQMISFTAKDTGIYTFTMDVSEGSANFELLEGAGIDSSWEEEVSPYLSRASSGRILYLVLEAGQTIVWKVTATSWMGVQSVMTGRYSDQRATPLVVGREYKAVVENDWYENSAAGFVFTAPVTGTFKFWSTVDEEKGEDLDSEARLFTAEQINYNLLHGNWASDSCGFFENWGLNYEGYCLAYDGNDENGNGYGLFSIEYELTQGQIVWLQVTGYDNTSGTCTVHVDLIS